MLFIAKENRNADTPFELLLVGKKIKFKYRMLLQRLFWNCFCKLINFNWRLITSQYWSGFCHAFTWMSHGCACVLHPESPSNLPPPHPSGSSQCTSPEHPVSCTEPGLEIYFTYGNVHVSMLFSQIILPSPSPMEFKRLFFTSMSLAVSRIGSFLPSF